MNLPSFIRQKPDFNTYGFRWEIMLNGKWVSVKEFARSISADPRDIRFRIQKAKQHSGINFATFSLPVSRWFVKGRPSIVWDSSMDIAKPAERVAIPWVMLERQNSMVF